MATGIPVSVGELVDVPTINSWARGLLRKTTAKTVASTTSATDLLNGEFTIPAGAMSTDRIVKLTAWGDWKQNTGASRDIPGFQLVLGGTTLVDTNSIGGNVVQSLNQRFGWRFVCEIQNLGAANSQSSYMSGNLAALSFGTQSENAYTTGNGTVLFLGADPGSNGLALYEGGHTSHTVDTTAACALVFNVYNGFSSANYETKLVGALAQIA